MAQLIQKKKVKTTMKKKEMEKVKMLKKRKAVNNKKGSEKEVLNLSDWTTTFLSLGTSWLLVVLTLSWFKLQALFGKHVYL